MFRIPLFLICSCFTANAAAQQYGHVWQFGENVGLDFNTSTCIPAVLTNGQNEGFEGCASVCDANGTLLFYTNAATIWNAGHAPMPNGQVSPGLTTLSQVLIQQVPGSATEYVVVTTTVQGSGPGQSVYHVVDMALAGGFGDVVSTDNPLYEGITTEHVAATRHANGTDVWILLHDYPSNAFLAYLLTSSGTLASPVVSNVGPAFAPCNSNVNARGEMKFSVDGSRLAIAGNGVGNGFGPSADSTNMLALFHFDNATGIVSDPLELPFARGDFGLSFSPDGTKLYGCTWKALNFITADTNLLYQFDLSSGDPAIIADSRVTLWSSPTSQPFGAIKLAPDGRIYVSRSNGSHLGVILSPDLPGTDSDYQHEGLYLNGATSGFGLNNYIEYVGCGAIPLSVGTGQDKTFTVFPNPATSTIALQGAPLSGPGTITVSDAAGRIVLRSGMTTNRVLDLSGLVPGPYLLRLQDTTGKPLASAHFVRVP